MSAASLSFRLRALALLLCTAALLLVGSGSTSVFDRDEARFALAVREMRERGDLVLPTNWGEPRYHKPILAYWCALAAERVFGPGELAWRLPSALAGLVTVAATLALARARFGESVALRAGAILGTSLVFVLEARLLTADALLLATTTLAFWAWLELREGPRRLRWQLLFWSSVALGILAKGVNVAFLAAAGLALSWRALSRSRRAHARGVLVVLGSAACAAAVPGVEALGPLLLALAATALLVLRPRRAGVSEWGAAWGLPLCAALVAAWFVPALLRSHGDFLREGVGHHMLERTSSAFEGHRGVPGYYLATGVLAFFPWAAWLPAALRAAWKDPRAEFLLAWITGPWALLECLASKLPHYPLVTLPAVALVLALPREEARRGARRGLVAGCLFALPCLALAAGGIVVALRFDGRLGAWGWAVTAVAGAVLALPGLAPLLDRRPFPFGRAWAGSLVLYATLLLGLLPAYEARRLAKPLGAELARLARAGEDIHLVDWRPASAGCYLPGGHAVIADALAVETAITQGARGLFVVSGKHRSRFFRTDSEPLEDWESLATVSGLDGFEPRTLWILRRRGP